MPSRHVHFDNAEILKFYNEPAVKAWVKAIAEKVAEKARTGEVYMLKTDRPHAIVEVLASGQLTSGRLSRAATSLGLEINHRPVPAVDEETVE